MTGRRSSSHPPKKSSLREFARRERTGEDWRELGDIANVNDRVVGIVLGSDVEWYLEQLLLAYLPNATPEIFLASNGPLTDFYAKNHLAFSMGIIPKALLKDLEVVRRVRNAFAHARAPMRFSDAPIMSECQKMSSHPIHFKERAEEFPEEFARSEKENFFYSAGQVIIDLTTLKMIREISERRKKEESNGSINEDGGFMVTTWTNIVDEREAASGHSKGSQQRRSR